MVDGNHIVLPPLRQHNSPNQSARLHGIVPYLIVVHRPVGSYKSAEATLTTPRGDDSVSAHILTDSNREAVQLVPWDRKAWACASFNSVSYNIEVDDDAWNGKDPAGFATAARIVAFLCKKTGIPPVPSYDPLHRAGVVRHFDLGQAGGGHTDPTTDPVTWHLFLADVRKEFNRGGFRDSYGVGEIVRIEL